jgi:hypothetical protein
MKPDIVAYNKAGWLIIFDYYFYVVSINEAGGLLNIVNSLYNVFYQEHASHVLK